MSPISQFVLKASLTPYFSPNYNILYSNIPYLGDVYLPNVHPVSLQIHSRFLTGFYINQYLNLGTIYLHIQDISYD